MNTRNCLAGSDSLNGRTYTALAVTVTLAAMFTVATPNAPPGRGNASTMPSLVGVAPIEIMSAGEKLATAVTAKLLARFWGAKNALAHWNMTGPSKVGSPSLTPWLRIAKTKLFDF